MYEFTDTPSQHPLDARVTLCRLQHAFIQQISDSKIAIYEDVDQQDNYRVLQALGYQELKNLTRYAAPVTVNDDGTIDTEHQMPQALLEIVTNAATSLSCGLNDTRLSLTMGNLKNDKFHHHFSHTLTGAVINLGAQWQISHDEHEQVQTCHTIHIPPKLIHRSKPTQRGDERFAWTLSNIYTP